MGSTSSSPTEQEQESPPPPASSDIASAYYGNSAIRRDDRHEHWRDRMAEMFEIPPPAAEQAGDYLIEARRWMVPGMLLVSANYPDMKMVRTRQHVQRDQFDHYIVSVRRSGPMRVDAEGAQHHLGLMQPLLTDMSRPSSFDWVRGEGLSLFVRRDELDALLPRALDLHGVAPQGITGTLLANHFLMLERYLPQVSAEEAQGIKAGTLHLLAASLAPSVDSLGLARPAIDQGMTRLLRQQIERQLRDPQLSADSLSKQFRISRSALYRLFEPLGGVVRYIRERRLAHCHAILSKPGPRQYIERLAYEYGFSSASHFSRAFHEQYGYAPRDALHHPAHQGLVHASGRDGNADFRASLDALSR